MNERIATVKKIVYGGWGLAFHEDHTLFIPYTAPGDTVRFSVVRKKKGSLFCRIEEIVEPSPMRRNAECPVFGSCGGCHLLHLDYDAELEVKKEFVTENLRRIAGIITEPDGIIPSPNRFGYRNHAAFKIDRDGRAGFTMRESSIIVPFPADGCLLLPGVMRESIAAIPAGELPTGGEVLSRLDRFGAVHFWGLEEHPGPPESLMEAGSYLFPVTQNSFFQVNRFLNARLMELVVSLPGKAGRKLLDLYCGVGFFTLPLSKIVREAVGIEREPAAVRGASAAARLNKIINVKFRKGSVEQLLPRMRDVDLVVADPPRKGIPEEVMNGIIRLRAAELVLVSCEPPTFARDASRLVKAGYMLSRLYIIDLFPGTYHVEIAALFRRH